MRIRTVASIGTFFLTAWMGLAQSAKEGDLNQSPAPHDVRPATPDAYGSLNQSLVLGAAAFHPQGDATYDYESAGYIYRTGGGSAFWAPVNLPNGAIVDNVCVKLYDTHPFHITVEFGVYELTNSNASPPVYVSISSGANQTQIGYNQYCLPAFSHTFRAFSDFDGDGDSDYGAYRIAVYLTNPDNTMRLGGAIIRYHLQVKPAPAVASFPNDVPTSHPFFRFVEALASAGITAGCGAGSYCPDQPVTRGQMAVFLATALGLHWPN